MSTAPQEPQGDLQTALQHALKLLSRQPALAEEQAREILKAAPGLPGAEQLLGSALRRQGKLVDALNVMQPLSRRVTSSSHIAYELGLCYVAAGMGDEAVKMLRRAVTLDSKHSQAWLALGELYELQGMREDSIKAIQAHLATSSSHPDLATAAEHMSRGEFRKAEPLVREVLKKNANDVSAIRMLADIGIQIGQYADARNLLERCLEIAPDYQLARHNYAVVLSRKQELEEALVQAELLLEIEPQNPNYLILKSSILVRMGDHAPALEIYEKILADYPLQPRAQLNYGNCLKTVGRLDDAITAYRKAISMRPSLGEAYWSLSNLKTFRFEDSDITAMKAAVTEKGQGDGDDQAAIAFALGKALEDRGEYDESFHYYQRGNRIRNAQSPFNVERHIYNVARQIKTCDKTFFEERSEYGCIKPDPIFILGLPRAGSTLLEQILASHSQVEGTAELPDIIAMSRQLGGRARDKAATLYPEILADLTADRCRELGESYLETTRVQRSGTPFFIDKMPNNYLHIGLIHLILPNAKIIDARRHPMAGCFAGYKQMFAEGQTYTYDLENVGYYYRNYVKMMDHWDEALPGRVLRVQYEDMVSDSEKEIRRILDYCELPFEEQCLRFYETDRAIRTPSSEQVRQPIFTQGLEQWRNYEAHLEPLKKALGPLLDRYPI